MRPKSKIKLLILASVVFLFSLTLFTSVASAVECGINVTPTVCPSGTFCRPCDPPSLPNMELFIVQALGVVWALTGLIFFGLFIYNSYLFMFNKIEDSKKRMVQWIIGLLMILFAQPLVATVMKLIITDKSTCYEELRQPTFTFFFPNICTEPEQEVIGPPLKCEMPPDNAQIVCYQTNEDGVFRLVTGQDTICTDDDITDGIVSGCGAM